MATWEVEIIPQVVEGKTAYVNGTRTDGENIKTFTVSGWLGTVESRLALLDNLYAKHQASVVLDAQIAAFLAGLEEQAESNLNAREQ